MPRAVDTIPLLVADAFELAGVFRRHGEALAQSVGHTQSRWQVLSAASGDPRTVPQIARRLGVSRQNVQRIADRLISEGEAEYLPNPDHKGSPHLVLTRSGRAALERIGRRAASYHAAIADLIEDHEIRLAHATLKRLLGVLEQVERQNIVAEEN